MWWNFQLHRKPVNPRAGALCSDVLLFLGVGSECVLGVTSLCVCVTQNVCCPGAWLSTKGGELDLPVRACLLPGALKIPQSSLLVHFLRKSFGVFSVPCAPVETPVPAASRVLEEH